MDEMPPWIPRFIYREVVDFFFNQNYYFTTNKPGIFDIIKIWYAIVKKSKLHRMLLKLFFYYILLL